MTCTDCGEKIEPGDYRQQEVYSLRSWSGPDWEINVLGRAKILCLSCAVGADYDARAKECQPGPTTTRSGSS